MNDFISKLSLRMSWRVKQSALEPMLAAARPVHYLRSEKEDKQTMALQIAQADRISEGPVRALTAVELCSSHAIRRDPKTQRPDLQIAQRKGLSVYQYWMDQRRLESPKQWGADQTPSGTKFSPTLRQGLR